MENRVARSLERILARARPKLSRLPRLSALIEGEGGGESRPALESLLISSLSSSGDEGMMSSVEHHETLALWHLLGRRAAELTCSAAEGARFVEELFDAFEEDEPSERQAPGEEVTSSEPVGAPSELARRALLGAYLEGFVLQREEIARGAHERSALDALRLRSIEEGVDLLILAGRFAHPALSERLEGFGRELFRRESQTLIVDLGGLDTPRLHRDGLRELIAVAEAIGVEICIVDDRGEASAILGREAFASLAEAIMSCREGRSFGGSFRSRIRRLWRANEPN